MTIKKQIALTCVFISIISSLSVVNMVVSSENKPQSSADGIPFLGIGDIEDFYWYTDTDVKHIYTIEETINGSYNERVEYFKTESDPSGYADPFGNIGYVLMNVMSYDVTEEEWYEDERVAWASRVDFNDPTKNYFELNSSTEAFRTFVPLLLPFNASSNVIEAKMWGDVLTSPNSTYYKAFNLDEYIFYNNYHFELYSSDASNEQYFDVYYGGNGLLLWAFIHVEVEIDGTEYIIQQNYTHTPDESLQVLNTWDEINFNRPLNGRVDYLRYVTPDGGSRTLDGNMTIEYTDDYLSNYTQMTLWKNKVLNVLNATVSEDGVESSSDYVMGIADDLMNHRKQDITTDQYYLPYLFTEGTTGEDVSKLYQFLIVWDNYRSTYDDIFYGEDWINITQHDKDWEYLKLDEYGRVEVIKIYDKSSMTTYEYQLQSASRNITWNVNVGDQYMYKHRDNSGDEWTYMKVWIDDMRLYYIEDPLHIGTETEIYGPVCRYQHWNISQSKWITQEDPYMAGGSGITLVNSIPTEYIIHNDTSRVPFYHNIIFSNGTTIMEMANITRDYLNIEGSGYEASSSQPNQYLCDDTLTEYEVEINMTIRIVEEIHTNNGFVLERMYDYWEIPGNHLQCSITVNLIDGYYVVVKAIVNTTVNVTSYRWDMGVENETSKHSQIVAYTYTEDGNYTVTLTVTDENGEKESVSLLIEVPYFEEEEETEATWWDDYGMWVLIGISGGLVAGIAGWVMVGKIKKKKSQPDLEAKMQEIRKKQQSNNTDLL